MPSPPECLRLAGVSIALAVLLAEAYARVAAAFGLTAWVAAASVHTLLSAVVVVALLARGKATMLRLTGVGGAAPRWLAAAPWLAYLPAAVVLVGAGALTLASRQFAGPATPTGPGTELAWVLWIPLVEELVFRAGIGQAYRRFLPGGWGAWFAALTFAVVHAEPTLANILAGHIGMPLGPFLLGLGCEALLGVSGRLAPAVAFHAACNATAAVFAFGDPRWLDWLGFLYT